LKRTSIGSWCGTGEEPEVIWHDLRASPATLTVSDNVATGFHRPGGASSVLAEELAAFGASDIRERSHDVKFQGTLEVGYRACLCRERRHGSY